MIVIICLIAIIIMMFILAFIAYVVRKEAEKKLSDKKDIIPIAYADCDDEYDN